MTVKDIQGCVYILTVSLILGLGINTFSPAGIPLFGQWDKTVGTIMAGSNSSDAVHAKEINNPLKVKQMIDAGAITVIDVRLADVYDLGHLPGALCFPLSEFDQVIDRFQQIIKKETPILLYCSGVTCRDSHTFGGRLIKLGYTGVTVYSGGYSEWQEMGFEVE